MPKGGHNRKPTRLKLLQGTARPDRERNEPKPLPLAPPCPKWLPREAKREWRRLVPQLEKLGLVSRLDRDALADLCLTVTRLREAEAKVEELGVLIPSGTGWKKNPAVTAAAEYRKALARWAERFGLTPGDRGRLDLPQVENEEDEFEKFLREGQELNKRRGMK
jgi:P27 family predicted phage terminase small subunit